MKMNLPSLAAIVALTLGGALNANAGFTGFVDVNLAGWQALGAFDASDDTENTRLVINLAPGWVVTGFDYTNLSFTTSGDSWLSEFVISVNNTGITQWLDWRPSTTETGGSLGRYQGPLAAQRVRGARMGPVGRSRWSMDRSLSLPTCRTSSIPLV